MEISARKLEICNSTRACQSWESKGQLSVIAMMGGIMGYSDRAKVFSVAREDGLTLLDPLGEREVDSFLDTCHIMFSKSTDHCLDKW